MKFTNKHGLPSVFENLVRKDTYSKGEAQYSVTELIAPPRIRVLQRKHEKEMERDVSEFLWPLVGKAVHLVLQQGATEGTISEQRLFATVEGVVISGGIDLQVASGNEVDLTDWKLTSTWSVKGDVKKEWEEQLNVYAYLAHCNGRVARHLQVVAILRDWRQVEAERNPEYPQAPLLRVPVPLWTVEKQEEFVQERINRHAAAHFDEAMGNTLPQCSKEERWMQPDKYAVMKFGGKRAYKLFDTLAEAAVVKMGLGDGYDVQHRRGEPIRCKRDYCGVARWCDQYQGELKNG